MPRSVPTLLLTRCALALLLLVACPARAANPPVIPYPDLSYASVTHALMKLERFKPENQLYLDAYSFAMHCDVVKGSFRDEFRWNQARAAVRKWIEMKKPGFSTRVTVRSQIMFDRYDFTSRNFLFAPTTKIEKLNTFTTENRPVEPACEKPELALLPSRYRVVTNNPLTLPGLSLTEEQGRDLAQKLNAQGNRYRMVWVRFNIDILDSDFVGPSLFSNQFKGDDMLKVKATLASVEFFSDPEYKSRFYYYVPF